MAESLEGPGTDLTTNPNYPGQDHVGFQSVWDWLFGNGPTVDPVPYGSDEWERRVQGSFDASSDLSYTSEQAFPQPSAHFAVMQDGRVYSDTDNNGKYDMITATSSDGTNWEWNVGSHEWNIM